jgi:arginase family enzyme
MMQRFKRGITGADQAPAALLPHFPHQPATLLDLTPYQFTVTPADLLDPAVIAQQNQQTITAQNLISQAAGAIAQAGQIPLALGGDHSLTYPLLRGISQADANRPLGLVYIDAHFDLRPLEELAGVTGLISSGNSFRRLLEDPAVPLNGRNVVLLGLHDSGTPLFNEMQQYALEQGMTLIYDHECTPENLPAVVQRAITQATNGTEGVYLSLDIDAVQGEFAPGVSAPAGAEGLTPAVWLALVEQLAQQLPLAGVDLVEISARTAGWQQLFEPEYQPDPAAQAKFAQTVQLGRETLSKIMGSREWGVGSGE